LQTQQNPEEYLTTDNSIGSLILQNLK